MHRLSAGDAASLFRHDSRRIYEFRSDLKKIPKDQKKSMVEEVMEMVKITDMKNRLIKNLSKGYRQRVGLAQAILDQTVFHIGNLYHFHEDRKSTRLNSSHVAVSRMPSSA